MQIRRSAYRHRTGVKSRVYIPAGCAVRNIALFAPLGGGFVINDEATIARG
jgi:hypothetical protein